MNEITKQILIAWQKAHEQAEDNPSILMLNEKFSDLCIARMNVCLIADEMLYSIPVNGADYPDELTRHIKSNADKGCDKCWFSSMRGKNHSECSEKITEWFKSKDELLMYVELILINNG